MLDSVVGNLAFERQRPIGIHWFDAVAFNQKQYVTFEGRILDRREESVHLGNVGGLLPAEFQDLVSKVMSASVHDIP